MSTLGHPLSDLANLLMPWTITAATDEKRRNSRPEFHPTAKYPGLPSRDQCVDWYREVSGYDPRSELAWGVAFSMFRDAVIFQGIAARYASRQASSATAKEVGEEMEPVAAITWQLIEEAKAQMPVKSHL